MAILIRDAWLMSLDPPSVAGGELRIEGEQISAVGGRVEAVPGDEIVSAEGAVVMPGFVNGHSHLYSSLAVGMPPPATPPRDFREILERIWWRLDRALDLPMIEACATIGALDAIRAGTTTVVDHHSSPCAIHGSLDAIEEGLRPSGLRCVQCYETTDRNGRDGCAAGLAENERYVRKCADRSDPQFAAMVGAHAAFTLSDGSLAALGHLAGRHGVGVHIHVAEDPVDDVICRKDYGAGLIERLARAGILGVPSILAHGTHLSESDLAHLDDSPAVLVRNPRSNMNNVVGCARWATWKRPVLLGTDGLGSDMFAELQALWLKSRDAGLDLSPSECVRMLGNSARKAGECLGIPLGRLQPGAAADVVITDYVPSSPLTSTNLAAHLIFGMSSRCVRSVIIAGRWRLRNRMLVGLDEPALHERARAASAQLRERMQQL